MSSKTLEISGNIWRRRRTGIGIRQKEICLQTWPWDMHDRLQFFQSRFINSPRSYKLNISGKRRGAFALRCWAWKTPFVLRMKEAVPLCTALVSMAEKYCPAYNCTAVLRPYDQSTWDRTDISTFYKEEEKLIRSHGCKVHKDEGRRCWKVYVFHIIVDWLNWTVRSDEWNKMGERIDRLIANHPTPKLLQMMWLDAKVKMQGAIQKWVDPS